MIYFIDHYEVVEIHQIQCFLSVVECGSFRGAAEKLHKAQSAVSLSIKNLEDELGFKLFDRQAYRPSLTARGRSLLPQLSNLHQQLDQIQDHARFLQKGSEPKIKMAVSALFPELELSSILENFSLQFPFTELVLIQEVLSADEMLADESVDLALGEIFDERGQFEKVLIKNIEMLSVCSRNHPLAKQKEGATRSELKKHRQVILKSTVEKSQRMAGVETGQPQIGVHSFSLKKQLIMCGVGWGGMPRHLIESELKKNELVLTHGKILKVPLSLAWSRKKLLGPCAKFLISALQSKKMKPL